MSPRSSFAEAARTRDRIVRAAVEDASRIGLDSLTIGSLADRLHMSKAGVVGPFGSRENLQAAVLARASEIFRAAVVDPLADLPPGAPRLARLIDAWIDYLAECPFPGGCFVTAVSAEFDGRPGPLRDTIGEAVIAWRTRLIAEITAAQAETATAQRPAAEIASTLVGISMAVNQEIQLLADESAAERGRAAMRAAAGLPLP
ncbi:TetR/AcrR family transcriptional regulator [Nocardia terpenica]|uniref:TetR family transcriptional regulator n=1 Tax=Nocardia terpenica TaxID=455432 RepID=A0A291RM36_9NOCA|nr:TetR/AcrR family transcriptional regulator [Nocardia terpenica]ATL68368.1 TetR family transcriptional regulator [Nocardia terpenica]